MFYLLHHPQGPLPFSRVVAEASCWHLSPFSHTAGTICSHSSHPLPFYSHSTQWRSQRAPVSPPVLQRPHHPISSGLLPTELAAPGEPLRLWLFPLPGNRSPHTAAQLALLFQAFAQMPTSQWGLQRLGCVWHIVGAQQTLDEGVNLQVGPRRPLSPRGTWFGVPTILGTTIHR